MRRELIHVIGLDCDDPYAVDKLLRRRPELLREADMICGGRVALGKLKRHPDLSGKLLPLTPPLEPLYKSIFALRDQGHKVVILADGDPLFYGIGASLARRSAASALAMKPAISCLQAACARMNLPWHNIYCLSLHGRDDIVPLYDAIASGRPICILTGGRATPDALARLLLDRGADWFGVHIFENMGAKEEAIYHMSLSECATAFFSDAATMILTPARPARAPRLGLDEKKLEGAFSTKKPARGAILELLNIEPSNNVWDVGAGSGVLALEICALAHAGRVIAIEKDMHRCLDIQENRRKLGAVNLNIVCGEAPDCLEDLPEPQRIFMGGGFSGESALKILEKCAKALPRGGRFVASCILLDSFSLCRRFLEYLDWPMEMLQIQAATATGLGRGSHFAPLNPVFLLAAQKP